MSLLARPVLLVEKGSFQSKAETEILFVTTSLESAVEPCCSSFQASGSWQPGNTSWIFKGRV